jgi:hypothetical protein
MNAKERRLLRRSYRHKDVLFEGERVTWTPSFDHARFLRARDRAYRFERKGGHKSSRAGLHLQRAVKALTVPRRPDGLPDCACCLPFNLRHGPRTAWKG